MAGLTKYVLLFLSSQLCCLSSFVFVVVVYLSQNEDENKS